MGGFTPWGAHKNEFRQRLLHGLEKLEEAQIFEHGHTSHDDMDALKSALSERAILGYRVEAPRAQRLEQLEAMKAALHRDRCV